MKNILLLATALAFASTAALAGDATKAGMKKYHKGEETLVKKIGAGEASASEISELLRCYEAMAKESPPKGTKGSWDTKVGALIEGLKKIQGGGSPGSFKAAVACKACHDVHKGK